MRNHESIGAKESDRGTEKEDKVFRFQDDPDQYTEEELMANPAKRYHVNPDDFLILGTQGLNGPNKRTLPIDDTLGRYVRAAADCVSVIAGEQDKNNPLNYEADTPAADHIIYLDKSARPISWLVNIFWDKFTQKERPPHSYLAIDRRFWFPRVGVKLENGDYVKEPDGSEHLATFEDFRPENVTKEDLARIRALFIPGGINTEDVDEILNTPTSLDGKNITIVDEVSRSGSTLGIAKCLISKAIPEAASVSTYATFDSLTKTDSDGKRQMEFSPVWYSETATHGRGIGDINIPFFNDRYAKYPNPKTRAQKFGSIVLGSYIDVTKDPNNFTREITKEFKKMREEFEKGHILMQSPSHYNFDKWRALLEKQGVVLSSSDDLEAAASLKTYQNVLDDIQNRAPIS